jgi:glucosamine-phosphate N-acetyltransferase
MPSFTPDDHLDLLFSPDLILSEVKSQLPPDLHVRSVSAPSKLSPTPLYSQIRPLASTDYSRGHLPILSVLTIVDDPGLAAWTAQFNTMRSAPRTYYSLVIVNKASDTIVGVGTVFIERKFLRGLGSVGHIEDIAVDKNQQGKKLGLRIIQALTHISENSGCYKTILNCSNANIRELFCSPCLTSSVTEFTCSVLRKVWVRVEGKRDGKYLASNTLQR